jgi:hypothetical protein
MQLARARFGRDKARLVVTEAMLRFGNEVIPVDAVETVSYQVHGGSFEFDVTGAGDKISDRRARGADRLSCGAQNAR